MTDDYAKALEDSREASRRFRAAQIAYRDRAIDDAAFLAAKAEYDASMADFDAAYAKESGVDE